MIGSFLSPFERASAMLGDPILPKHMRRWEEEIALAMQEQNHVLPCRRMDECKGSVISAARLKIRQGAYGPAILSSRPGEAKKWECPCPNDCKDYEAVVPVDRLVMDRV
jgi:hypothetical protein